MTAQTKEAVAPGATAPERSFGPLTRTDIVRYAGASGDFNPIHHDEHFATGAGFPTVFSIGMFQAALVATFATDWLGAENVRRFAMRFKEQVWPGDVLTCNGTIVSVEESDEGPLAQVELTCTRQTGAVAVAAKAAFLVPAS